MEVKVSMSYLDDEKYSVKNGSGNELVVDMYAKERKEGELIPDGTLTLCRHYMCSCGGGLYDKEEEERF